jgi:hypothetical protein
VLVLRHGFHGVAACTAADSARLAAHYVLLLLLLLLASLCHSAQVVIGCLQVAGLVGLIKPW